LIVTFDDSVDAAALPAVPDAQIVHRYKEVFNGVSLVTKEANIEAIADMDGVTGVYPDQLLQLNTDVSPGFIGAPTVWSALGGQGSAGEGVIVGVLDSGIWPEHPSLSDPDPSGKPYAPKSGTYACDFGSAVPGDAPFTCNNKLIGAYRFMATFQAVQTLLPNEFRSARDDNGHGTHTATTAAGNGGVAASIFDISRGAVSGIAPRAQIIAYKVCGDSGCYQSDSVAAIDQAIKDGVDVINFSISGGASPFSDPVELAFLNAYDHGVFVAASAGNAGATPETVDHRGPWGTTVAASTSNRHFLSTITLTANNGDTLTLTGATVTEGISTPTPVVIANPANCALPAGSLAGVIAICDRIGTRLQVGYNAFQAGAAGMILRNVTPAQIDILTDNHFLPSVHISIQDGTTLQQFMTSHTGVMATFTQGEARPVLGDRIAGFSSRGGPGQTLGISKPDVTAPGIQILAGTTPMGATALSGRPGQLFQSIQGTSMSSPHVAGAAALLKALRPDWTPGQIKSALMTTAKTEGVVKEDSVTPATPFDDGSGRIDLTVAGNPGLTIAETAANFVAHRNDLWNANYPSIYHPALPGAITVQRTVKSLLGQQAGWEVKATAGNDWSISVPANIRVPGNGETTFAITIDARNVPIGQVRHGEIRLHHGTYRLHIPVTIVRRAANVTLSKSCAPTEFNKKGLTACTITFQNTSFDAANVTVVDNLPANFSVVNGSLSGATLVSPNQIRFEGVVAGAAPADVAIAPGGSPAGGYLPLSLFGINPISGVGDDTITNFNVPAFSYAGETWTSIGISSNGYIVVGGGSGPDNTINNQNFPNPNRPNNVLAPFWTDLNPAAAGAIRMGTLTDGSDSCLVVDWQGVRDFSLPRLNSFQIWIGVSGDAHPGEDISFAYGAIQSNGDGGFLSVGAENRYGNRGGTIYFNGTGTLPSNGTQLRVTSTPGAPGESRTITFSMTTQKPGAWQNCAEMTASLFEGVAISCVNGVVR
ncbi:MAG TPA: S8 family serine peptidase, partial [Caldilineaceae bacterium]|nr:S8 family serine peptidase [Caldilineaceae bacterium]